jgi:hypothetical protein
LRDLDLRDFFFAAGLVDLVVVAGAWTSGFIWAAEAFESVDLEAACGSVDCEDADEHTKAEQITTRKSNLE